MSGPYVHPSGNQANSETNPTTGTSSTARMGRVERFVEWLLGGIEWFLSLFIDLGEKEKGPKKDMSSLQHKVSVGPSKDDKSLRRLNRQMNIRLAGPAIENLAKLCAQNSEVRLDKWSPEAKKSYCRIMETLGSRPETSSVHDEIQGFFRDYMKKNSLRQPMGKHFEGFLVQYEKLINNETYHQAPDRELLEEMAQEYDNGRDLLPDHTHLQKLSEFNNTRVAVGVSEIISTNRENGMRDKIPGLIAAFLRGLKD